MTYSRKHKYIFIHINKTGGTTISNILQEYDQSAQVMTHRFLYPTKKYRSVTNRESATCVINDNLYEYKIITCIRNPWSRILSCYKYRQSRKTIDTVNVPFEDWLLNRDIYKSYKTPECWIKFNQLDWVSTDKNVYNNCTFMKFESIEEETTRMVNETLNINIKNIPHKNKTTHLPYHKYYTGKTIDYVGNLYKKDIETFNFRFKY